MKRVLNYQLVVRCISVNLVTFFGLSIGLRCISVKRETFCLSSILRYISVMLLLLIFQLVLRNISFNVETSIGLSICFKMYKC